MTHISNLAELEKEILSLRETNRKLNRRLSHLDAPFRKEIAHLTAERDTWRNIWKKEFDRMIASNEECKLIYIECAKVLGLPYFSFHSVMDIWKKEGIYARVIHSYGTKVADPVRVLDVVKRALNKDSPGTEDTNRFRRILKMVSTKSGVGK